MDIDQYQLAVIAALTAAAEDPDMGRVRVKRGLHADIQDTPTGRVLVVERAGHRVVLTRLPATPERSSDYPHQLPFVPNATVWWTGAIQLAAAWVDLDSPTELAAALTTQFISEGWFAETNIVMKRMGITVLKKATRTRSVGWGPHHVYLHDAEGPLIATRTHRPS
jgi:hypothetical protein